MNVSHLPPTLLRGASVLRDRVVEAQQEATTGQLADPVATLGTGRGRTLSWLGEADRLDVVRESNALVTARLSATAAALSRLGQASGDLTSTLVGAIDGTLERDFVRDAAAATRETVTRTLNATFGGAHLFAGVTSQTPPIDGTGAGPALEARFAARFGHASDDPAARLVSADDAGAFTGEALDWLTGPGWPLVSQASDRPVTARIAPGESIDASLSANETAAREAYAAAFLTERLFDTQLDDAALAAVAGELASTAASASSGTARLEGRLGLAQARIARADERLTADADGLRAAASQVLGVDAFEAAQRFNAAVTQLETAYALTGRLNELSLTRFL